MADLSGRKVFVTGSNGFIGSHLVERLVRDGATVTAFCEYNSNSSRGWLDAPHCEVHDQFETIWGDVRDPEFMRHSINGTDIVMHLAALIAIPHSYQSPRSYVQTNVMGTLNVLEACRYGGVDRMVHTSTSEVYGTPDAVPITESHALKGQSPYSASKIAADKLAESYANSFDLPVVTLRPFNTYGPRQSQRAVIPAVLNQLLDGVSELSLGSLEPRRDFTFVADTVDGLIRSATADLDSGEVIHLGTGKAVSIGELVAICADVVGHHPTVVVDEQRVRPEKSEVDVLLSDPGVALSRLGWKPNIGLREGLAKCVEWIAVQGPVADSSTYRT